MNIFKLFFFLLVCQVCIRCAINPPKNYQSDKDKQLNKLIRFEELSPEERPIFAREGMCFKRFEIAQKALLTPVDYAIYTGDVEQEEVELDTILLIVKEPGRKWVKKKADRNCLSSDPEDCLVWCLVNSVDVEKPLIVLRDTTQSDKYYLQHFTKDQKIFTPSKQYLKQVICTEQITELLVIDIQKSLKELDYYKAPLTASLDENTMESLMAFQYDHQLTIGVLDFETLAGLGITIDSEKE